MFAQVRKGDTIGEFLRAVQQQLAPEFREIRTTSVENLLYVKEDLIIPHVSWTRNQALNFNSNFVLRLMDVSYLDFISLHVCESSAT